MSVHRRGNRYYYMFDVGPEPATGKRRRKSESGFKLWRDAARAEREARRAFELGAPVPGDMPTVAAAVDDWLARRRQSLQPPTWASYRDVLVGHVVPRRGALRLDRVTPKHFADLGTELLASGSRDPRRGPGLSERTVRYTLGLFSQVLDDAVKRGVLVRNPAEHVDMPRRK
jgi:hypothetical protein